jgi:putative hemolysin
MDNDQLRDFKPINIRELMMEKNASLGRLIPGFIYKMIHNIMRLDFMNGFMKRYGHLSGVSFVEAAVKDFEITEEISGLDRVPQGGRYIFASNHPLGGFDSLLLMASVHRHMGAFRFLVNDVLMKIPNLRPVFVPVNKYGGNSRMAARMVEDVYASDMQVLIFPSGYASRKIRGKVMDLSWQKHFISKAIQYKRDVVPVYISGMNSERFYWLARLRSIFRVKWNLEMFLLPDETYRHRKKTVQLIFGEPIAWTVFDKSKSHPEWAEWVREKVYSLAQDKQI